MKNFDNFFFAVGAVAFCVFLACAEKSWAADQNTTIFYIVEDGNGDIAVEQIPEQPVSDNDITVFSGLLKLCYGNWDCKVQFGGMLAEQQAKNGEIVVHTRYLGAGVNMSIELVTRDFKRMGGVTPDHSFVLRTMRVEFKITPDNKGVYISCMQMEPFAPCHSLAAGGT